MTTTADVRAWLKDNNYPVGQRGRIHPDHMAAWQAAHTDQKVEKSTVAATKSATLPNGESPTGNSLTREEQETVITYTMADDVVRVYSGIVRDITRMEKDDNYTLVKETWVGTSRTAEFTCPVEKFKFGSRSTRNLTEQQRKDAAERLAAARAAN